MVSSDAAGTGGFIPRTVLPTHNLTRYLRLKMEVNDGVLRWEVPRALFGIIPIGTHRLALPVAEVESATIGRAARPLLLVLGLAAIAVPPFFTPWWVMVPMILLGVWLTLVSLGPRLEVWTVTGERHRAPVCFGHQFDADLFAEAVVLTAQEARAGVQPDDG